MSFIQRLLSKFHPTIESQSRRWYVKCTCGKEPSIWEMGGVRCTAAGKPTKLVRCPFCKRLFMGKLHKRPAE